MSWASGDVWRLMRGDEVLGEITLEEGDFPWVSGRFVPRPGFAQVKPLFDEELELSDAMAYVEPDDTLEAWERLQLQITTSMTLLSPEGPITNYLLHIQDDQAWFRWEHPRS